MTTKNVEEKKAANEAADDLAEFVDIVRRDLEEERGKVARLERSVEGLQRGLHLCGKRIIISISPDWEQLPTAYHVLYLVRIGGAQAAVDSDLGLEKLQNHNTVWFAEPNTSPRCWRCVASSLNSIPPVFNGDCPLERELDEVVQRYPRARGGVFHGADADQHDLQPGRPRLLQWSARLEIAEQI